MGREDEVKLIAYNIWEEEGCLHGKDCEYWLRAEAIWQQQQKLKSVIKSSTTGSKQIAEKNTKVVQPRRNR